MNVLLSIVDPKNQGIVKQRSGNFKQLIQNNNWSPALFKSTHRINVDFDHTSLLVYDIDKGMSLKQARDVLDKTGYKYIVGTTRNHQKQKGKQSACDRFRIILYLSTNIIDHKTYQATWEHYKKTLFPICDDQCKDVARYYYPCKEIVYEKSHGKTLSLIAPKKETSITSRSKTNGKHGLISMSTMHFLLHGAPDGEWHKAFIKACFDMKEQGYNEDEAFEELSIVHTLDAGDEKQLSDVYNNRETKYEYREKKVDYLSISDLISDTYDYLADTNLVFGTPTQFKKFDDLLGGGFRLGELTGIGAEAKAGKTTLANQLIFNFLERGIPCGYASREVRPAQEVLPHLLSLAIKENLFKNNLSPEIKEEIDEIVDKWPLYFAPGYGVFPYKQLVDWMTILHDKGVEFFWLDHFQYMLQDVTDLKEVTSLIQAIKQMVNELNVHVFLVLQINKTNPDSFVRIGPHSFKGGSTIIHTLDNILLLDIVGKSDTRILKVDRTRHRLAKSGSIKLTYDDDSLELFETKN